MGAVRTETNEEISFARNWVLLHAKAYNLQAIDIVQKKFKPSDLEVLRNECEQGAVMGYTGKQVIHPAQVTVVQDTFRPSGVRVAWSYAVIKAAAAHAESGKGAFDFEGTMIDAPTVKIALNIVGMHEAIESFNAQ